MKVIGFARNIGWLVIIAAALGLSTWSLYALAHDTYRVPMALAAVVSAVFDGGALVAADLRLAHAREGESGGGARLAVLAFAAGSVFLNATHALHDAYGTPGAVLFSAPAVVAMIVFELKSRHTYRTELGRHGRLAPPLPPFGKLAGLLHPLATFTKVRDITGSRITSIPVTVLDWTTESLETPDPLNTTVDGAALAADTPPPWTDMSKADAVIRADRILPHRTSTELAAVLAEVGVQITAGAVRTARTRARNHQEQ